MNFDAFLPPFSWVARRVSGGTSTIHQTNGPCAHAPGYNKYPRSKLRGIRSKLTPQPFEFLQWMRA